VKLGEIIPVIVTLVLGGAGWSAIYTFVVRPRVFLDTRHQWTVRVFGEKHREKIEKAMKELGVPTGSFEVAWWNRGLRRANNIIVEVSSAAPIETWEVLPRADDIAGGWVCTNDPLHNTADHYRLRLEQKALMPRTQCQLVIGYSPLSADESRPQVRAYQDDREIKPHSTSPSQVLTITAFLIGIILPLALVRYLLTTEGFNRWHKSLPAVAEWGVTLGILVIAMGMMLGPLLLLFKLGSGGSPPWLIGDRRRSG